jgi:hypothetical protein
VAARLVVGYPRLHPAAAAAAGHREGIGATQSPRNDCIALAAAQVWVAAALVSRLSRGA